MLAQFGLSMGDLMVYFFDPDNHCDWYTGFWKKKAYFDDFMDHISIRKNATPSGKDRMHRWAVEHVESTVHSEAQAITKDRCLQTRDKPIDENFVLGFRLTNLEDLLIKFCPTMLGVVDRFATSTAQLRTMDKTGGLLSPSSLRKRKVSEITGVMLHIVNIPVSFTTRWLLHPCSRSFEPTTSTITGYN